MPKRQNSEEFDMSISSEILEAALPRSVSKQVAVDLHTSERTVYRWRAGEEPSPLDRFIYLLRAVYLNHPEGAEIIHQFISSQFAALKQKHAVRPEPELVAAIHRECSEVVQACLNGKSATDIRREILEAQAVLNEKLRQLDAAAEIKLRAI